MLTLTDEATATIHGVLDEQGLGTNGGLRIVIDPEHGYLLNLAFAPAPDDVVIGEDGAHVFLDPTTAVVFDRLVLDGGQRESGIVFTVSEQD